MFWRATRNCNLFPLQLCSTKLWSSWIKGLENVLSLSLFENLFLVIFLTIVDDVHDIAQYKIDNCHCLALSQFSSSEFTALLDYDCHTHTSG